MSNPDSSNKNFLNIHVLISHSPSCLNRDDMNMQKSAIFGGVRRVRVSSQSLKRAMRHSDYYRQNLGAPSVRSNKLPLIADHYIHALKDSFSVEQVAQAVSWIAGKEGIEADVKVDSVAPWAAEEVAYICQMIIDAGEEADPKKLEKQIAKSSKPFREALGNTYDIALSGRMATFGLMSKMNMDAAMAVAHAITTHPVDADLDWFTAVDDLIIDEGEVGAGHLDTQEFSAGVFYRYASINLKQLQLNLGLIGNIGDTETDKSRSRALEIAKHAVHMLATVTPDAKQNSFAAHNLADLVLVSLSDQPISLANAFEAPVKKEHQGGFLTPSIRSLLEYWQNIHTGYGLDERTASFLLEGAAEGELPGQKSSLAELEQWLEDDGVKQGGTDQ